jgi:hypothetical protein
MSMTPMIHTSPRCSVMTLSSNAPVIAPGIADSASSHASFSIGSLIDRLRIGCSHATPSRHRSFQK